MPAKAAASRPLSEVLDIIENLYQGIDPRIPVCGQGQRAVGEFRRADLALTHQLCQPQPVILQVFRYVHVSPPY